VVNSGGVLNTAGLLTASASRHRQATDIPLPRLDTSPMTPANPPGRPLWPVYMKLVVVAAIWGGTFIAGRVLAGAMPPLMGAVGRYLIATVGLLGVAVLVEGGLPRLSRQQAVGTLGLGVTGVFAYNVAFFDALSELPASRTALFVALNPVFTLIGAALFLRERLSLIRVAGIVLALAGVTIVISRGDLATLLNGGIGAGERSMMIAVLAWATYTLIGRSIMRSLSVIAATAYASLWGTALLVLDLAIHWQPIPATALAPVPLLALVYVGLVGTVVAFVWFGEGVKAIGAARAAVFTNLVPVFGVAQAALILGEPVIPSMIFGGAIAICGVMIANTPAR
jgi:drug/metabolite transporter (DMT)-like permease